MKNASLEQESKPSATVEHVASAVLELKVQGVRLDVLAKMQRLAQQRGHVDDGDSGPNNCTLVRTAFGATVRDFKPDASEELDESGDHSFYTRSIFHLLDSRIGNMRRQCLLMIPQVREQMIQQPAVEQAWKDFWAQDREVLAATLGA
jgi:hypothetical protein